ncbi:MAG: hypothetical protein ACOCVP_02115 [Wenzhouxiangella sp.]
MRCTLFVLLFVFGVSGLAVATPIAPAAEAKRSEQAEFEGRMIGVAETLLASPAPAERAAGLLLAEQAKLWQTTAQPVLGEAEFDNELHGLIEEADCALTRALLAQLCGMTDRVDDCRRRGLDEAIVALDGAELLARLHLTELGDLERARDVMVAAERVAPRQAAYAMTVLDGTDTRSEALSARAQMAAIFALASSTFPPLSPIENLCQRKADHDPALDQACERLLSAMMDQADNLLLTSLASALAAQRAEAAGNALAMARHAGWRAELSEFVRCTGAVEMEPLAAEQPGFIREFLQHWQHHGEAGAHAFMAARADIDCASPQPPPVPDLAIR